MNKNKKITLLIFIGVLFFVFFHGTKVVLAETNYACGCWELYNEKAGGDIGKSLGNGASVTTESLCQQLCADWGGKSFCIKSKYEATCTPKKVEISPSSTTVQVPFSSQCSCDNGIPQMPAIISNKSVETKEGCIVICQQAAGATRMKFDASTGGGFGQWESIPAPIGPVTSTVPTKLDYQLLEQFPGFFDAKTTMNTSTKNDFPALILAIYKFGIWTVGIAGLFMLVVGGFMYMTSAGNTSSAGNARGIISDALLGIVAALGAYLILYVINPDLTRIDIGFTAVKVSENAQAPSGTMSDADARALLKQSGIDVAPSSGNCTDINNSACTSLQGIPERTVSALINIQNLCKYAVSGCKITITGGTEAGHQSHGMGLPAVDVRSDPALKKYLGERKTKNELGLIGVSQICTTTANQDLSYRCGGFSETSEHFHLYFGV